MRFTSKHESRQALLELEPPSGRVFPTLCWGAFGGENDQQYAQRAKGMATGMDQVRACSAPPQISVSKHSTLFVLAVYLPGS